MQDDPPKPLPPDAGAAHPATPTSVPLPHPAPTHTNPETPAGPAWANDLRKLYDAVVEEPLPDSLIALLSQLDAED